MVLILLFSVPRNKNLIALNKLVFPIPFLPQTRVVFLSLLVPPISRATFSEYANIFPNSIRVNFPGATPKRNARPPIPRRNGSGPSDPSLTERSGRRKTCRGAPGTAHSTWRAVRPRCFPQGGRARWNASRRCQVARDPARTHVSPVLNGTHLHIHDFPEVGAPPAPPFVCPVSPRSHGWWGRANGNLASGAAADVPLAEPLRDDVPDPVRVARRGLPQRRHGRGPSRGTRAAGRAPCRGRDGGSGRPGRCRSRHRAPRARSRTAPVSGCFRTCHCPRPVLTARFRDGWTVPRIMSILKGEFRTQSIETTNKANDWTT